MVGNLVKELNIPKTFVLSKRGHVTMVKFREKSLELMNAKLKYLKEMLSKHFCFQRGSVAERSGCTSRSD